MKIKVLLSSYNGYEFIEDQIKSIYDQTFKNFELIVRDDGSDDEFRDILRKYRDKYGFTLVEGENLGFLKSFMKLLEDAGDADLYAFADQDDIWLPDKLLRAAKWYTEKLDESIPQLFHGAYDNVDSDTKERISTFYFSEKNYGFRRSITENHYSGFAMVINRKLRDMMLMGDVDSIVYHDWWAGMIVKAFGQAYSDKKPTALHRVHGDNITTFSLKTRLDWLWKTLTKDNDIKLRSKEFDRCFGDELSKVQRNQLRLFSNEKYNLKYAFIKVFYPRRWRPIISSELVVRFLMLIGKI